MLKASNISKHFGGRAILDGVSFVVNAGERMGVVAPNGAGKTTLLRILAGELAPDGGATDAGGDGVAIVRQGFSNVAAVPVADVFPRAFRALDAHRRVADAGKALAEARDARALEDAQRAYELAMADAGSGDDVAASWHELELRDIAPGEVAGSLSGGEQTKLALLDAFASGAGVLLLDEPTNNLDLDACLWLDEHLRAFAGAAVIVSHDRALLDEHADAIIDLDPRTGRAEVFAGDYSAYATEKARRREAHWAAYRRQQDNERRVRQEIRDIKSTASRRERSSQNDFYRRKAKKVARRAVVLERRLERGLEGGRIEKPVGREYTLKTEIRPVARGGDRMLAVEGVTLSVGDRVLVEDASLQLGWGERAVLSGPNGSGKTTLLRAIAGEIEPHAGAVLVGPAVRVGYLPQETALSSAATSRREETPVSLVRAAAPLSETEARRFLHRFLFEGDAAHTPVASLSYGERRRLSLALLVLGGANLLLLDEPTNHLDIPSREALETALDSYEGAMLAVTHDRYFIERFGQRLFALEERRLREV